MRALVLLAWIGILVGGGGATAAAATKVKRYEAWTPGGNPRVAEFTERRGDCNSSSYVSGTSDAWRCYVGSTILDPCFANLRATSRCCAYVPRGRAAGCL
jgi:hypothetical protein